MVEGTAVHCQSSYHQPWQSYEAAPQRSLFDYLELQVRASLSISRERHARLTRTGLDYSLLRPAQARPHVYPLSVSRSRAASQAHARGTAKPNGTRNAHAWARHTPAMCLRHAT